MGYFGLSAGMSFLVGLGSEYLVIIFAAITWPLRFAALVAACFQAVGKMHAHTLSSPCLLARFSSLFICYLPLFCNGHLEILI